jgi:uncharacterized delta-60 repeat protein
VFTLALQPDGKVLIGGNFTIYNSNFAASDYVMRLNADGTRDTSFNAGGSGANNIVRALAVQANGKILIGGIFTAYNGDTAASDCVMRLNADGTRDTTFNTNGTGVNSIVYVVALQPEGKVLIGGYFTAYNGDFAVSDSIMRLLAPPPNTAPVASATPNPATTGEDTPIQLTLNGTDSDDDSLIFTITGQPGHGSLSSVSTPNCAPVNNCTATITYTPILNYNGPDFFKFKANDGTEDSAEITVSINVNSPPTPTWTARDIAVGGDNKLRGLWSHTDGRATLWTVSPVDGGFEFNRSYGPYHGWTAKAIAAGADDKTRALWTHADGSAALWVVSPADGNLEFNTTYGPYSNWTASDLAVGADNKLRVLWTHTDGRVALWVVLADGSLEVNDTYDPYEGWSARALAAGADNKFRLLWANVDGRAALWTLGAERSFEFNGTYGPYGGWTPGDIAVGSDNQTRALWTHTDGRAALWVVRADASLAFNHTYGPYSGWSCQALGAGPDNLLRALWTHTDGRAALWVVGDDGNLQFNYTYGPY